jgi:hypothetical protein
MRRGGPATERLPVTPSHLVSWYTSVVKRECQDNLTCHGDSAQTGAHELKYGVKQHGTAGETRLLRVLCLSSYHTMTIKQT